MKNEIYNGMIIPAYKAVDGETPECVVVTEENNGYAIWRTNHEGIDLVHFEVYRGRDATLERAVMLAAERRNKQGFQT